MAALLLVLVSARTGLLLCVLVRGVFFWGSRRLVGCLGLLLRVPGSSYGPWFGQPGYSQFRLTLCWATSQAWPGAWRGRAGGGREKKQPGGFPLVLVETAGRG